MRIAWNMEAAIGKLRPVHAHVRIRAQRSMHMYTRTPAAAALVTQYNKVE
jgi:ribosomal protein L11